ncbi:Uncharacterised protein [Vibrio cholerae]|nr:Uncharacterised protein [Vibrio cholerae]
MRKRRGRALLGRFLRLVAIVPSCQSPTSQKHGRKLGVHEI